MLKYLIFFGVWILMGIIGIILLLSLLRKHLRLKRKNLTYFKGRVIRELGFIHSREISKVIIEVIPTLGRCFNFRIPRRFKSFCVSEKGKFQKGDIVEVRHSLDYEKNIDNQFLAWKKKEGGINFLRRNRGLLRTPERRH